jgi:dTDP-4-amino-4,6-dideoxygalactose transaminase
MYVNWLNRKDYDFSIINKKLENSRLKNHFTNSGPLVKELETWFREILQIENDKSVYLTSNGTTALHAIVSAINHFNNKELIYATQDFTFPSSILGPLRNTKIVDMTNDHQVCINELSEVDGLIITNVFGNSLDLNTYEEWAKTNKKILIIDNAATPFTFYQKRNTLNYGNASFISLHHTKPFGFGEGGLIIADKKYSDSIERVINFGFDKLRNWNEWGSNYRMSDISAAFIYQHLEINLDKMIKHNIEISDAFKFVCMNNGWQMWNDKSDGHPFLSSLIFFSNNNEELFGLLKRFEWKKYYKPLIGMPVSNKIYEKIICLPCHLDVTTSDILSLKW